MGFTHYYHGESTQANVAKANVLYQQLLKSTKTNDNKNLYDIFKKDNLEKPSNEFDENFHEISRDEEQNPVIRNLDVKSDFDFMKTVRKNYDVSVLLSYLYLSYLDGDLNRFSSDMEQKTEYKLKYEFFNFASGTSLTNFREALQDYIIREDIDFDTKNLDEVMMSLVGVVRNKGQR